MFKMIFAGIVISLIVMAMSPAVMAWGTQAKKYLIGMFTKD